MAGDHLTAPDPDDDAAEVVRGYLAAVAAALIGPQPWRADVLAELRDGLDDAITDHADGGMQPAAAARAAVAEFGDPYRVAAGFAGEAAARVARRVAVTLLATGPLVAVSWLAAFAASGAPMWQGRLSGVWVLMPVIGLVLAVAVPAALLAVVATGRAERWLSSGSRLASRAAALAAGLCAGGDVLMLVVFSLWLVTTTSGVLWPVAVWAMVVSGLRLVLASRAARHCAAVGAQAA